MLNVLYTCREDIIYLYYTHSAPTKGGGWWVSHAFWTALLLTASHRSLIYWSVLYRQYVEATGTAANNILY
jgi:hypothetical protein